MKILFLVPYPSEVAPSQRFRFEQYLKCLQEHGMEYELMSFLDLTTWKTFYQPGTLKKILALVRGYFSRIKALIQVHRFDVVFIHREATPVGPPIFEWVMAKLFRKKIIYDFDDAIWLSDPSVHGSFVNRFKSYSKVAKICRWSHKVSCGNAFLANYAEQFNSRVVINPTTIDTVELHVPRERHNEIPIIGWTGTHSTNKYLRDLQPVLAELSKSHDFIFRVISNMPPDFDLQNCEFVPWSKDSEMNDLNSIDIGVMPLTDDLWVQGKCGFKALQYMALEIPALVSPVGVNKKIVEHGKQGYHCATPEDWHRYLVELLEDGRKRLEMGKGGRRRVVDHYSVLSNTENFISLFK